MRAFIASITAVAFLAHMLLGCCAHHARTTQGMACDEHAHGAPSGTEAVHGHNCHHHAGHDPVGTGHGGEPGDDSQQHSQHDSPCPVDSCTGSQCVFLTAGKVQLAKSATVGMLAIPSCEVTASFWREHSAHAIDTGGHVPLPVRLHLFNRVLVI